MRHVYGQSKRKSVLSSSGRFRGKRFYAGWLAAAFAGMAALPLVAAEIAWQPQNGSTDISDAENWAGGVLPGNGDIKKFGNGNLSGDYTVKIPAATAENPYRDKSGLFIDGLNDGQTVTLDATGASWLQMGGDGQAWQDNVPFRVRSWDHIFDIDNAHNTSSAANNFGFSLTDGTISFKRDFTNGSVLTFNGDFNMAVAPDGTENQHRTVLFHDTNANSANSKIIFHGGESTLRYVQMRGKTKGNEFRVDGGLLHVLNGLAINEDSTGVDTDAYMHVTGDGQVSVDSGSVWIGRNNDGRGVLRIDGNGKFNMNSGAVIVYFPDGSAQRGLLSIGENGEYRSVKGMNVGHNGGTAEILVEGKGVLDDSGSINFGAGNGCNASLTMQDEAYVNWPAVSMMRDIAADQQRTGVITLKDDAVLDIMVRFGTWVNGASGDLTINMSDNAKLRASRNDGNNWILFGDNNTSKFTLNLAGGTIEKFGGGELVHFQLKGGAESEYNFAGVTLDTQNFAIEGHADTSAPDAWHIAHQTAGTINVRWHGSGDGLDIRGGNGRNCMYLLEGGTLNVGNMMRVGHGNTDSSKQWRSVFRQTGGQANINANVNMCDSATMAEFELLGGRTRLTSLRGWNQSVARNANGAWATALFDGGTIEPWSNNQDTIVTMPELRLGTKGLTFDTVGYSETRIAAKFQNEGEGTEDEVDGLFVKTGAGTLKAKMIETDDKAVGEYAGRVLKSTHTYTRIDQGTLQLTEAADAAFGKNITVKGGAKLSLEGTAETLTVDTLTLGDGNGVAVLALDAGDKIVVNAENGLSVNAAMVDFSFVTVNDIYPVFVCAGAVDIAAVSDINIIPNADHDCEWTSSYDDGTDLTTFSIHVADAGTIGKIITYGNGSVTTNGEGRVARLIANETGTQYGQLDLRIAAAATVDAGATLTLGGDLHIPAGGTLSKRGSGKLVVDGDNSGFAGSFASHGGTLEVDGVEALGKDPLSFPLVLGNGTFKYTGDAVTFNAALKFQGETAGKSVILENDGDMTFPDVQHVSGTFVKKGVGALTLDLPAGSFKLGNDAVDGDYGVQHGAVVFPGSGDVPESKTGLCGVTIAEGALKIKGKGVDKTTVSTENTSLLGTGYAAKAAPVLEVEDARVNFGKGSRHSHIMAQYPEGAPVPEVRLRNAYLYTNSGNIGNSSNASDRRGPIITMKDSVFWGDYNTYLGVAGFASPEIDADNSSFITDGMYGITIAAAKLTADFYGTNAVFGSYSKTEAGANFGGRLASQNHVTGEVKIRDGARMKTTRGIDFAFGSLSVVFDGGIFEIASHNVESQRACTSVWQRAGMAFTTQGKGLEILIAEGSTHDFNFPVAGEGRVVKTGEGTFELVEARAEGEKLLQYTGGTVVSNGTFVVDGSLVADGAKVFEVCAGAVLDLNGSALTNTTIAGAGRVVNGTLVNPTLAYDADALTTFDGIEFDGVLFVDFGRTAEDPLDRTEARAGILVAHYAEGTVPEFTKVKALNTGIPRAKAGVSCVDGDIVITTVQTGFEVRLR
ncbi:MAG: hypothetical protein IKB76_00350 [Kiritimatiellae bacterium]|nr:hypothetical protein [Kiritimatiellia bacterium]